MIAMKPRGTVVIFPMVGCGNNGQEAGCVMFGKTLEKKQLVLDSVCRSLKEAFRICSKNPIPISEGS